MRVFIFKGMADENKNPLSLTDSVEIVTMLTIKERLI